MRPPDPGQRVYPWLLVAVPALATYGLWLTRGWVWLGVPHFDPALEPFSDAFSQLLGAEQCRAGKGEWVHGACFVPSLAEVTHMQAYEPWFTFERWGLGIAHFELVAVLLIALFYVAYACAMRPRSVGELGLCLLLLATSAVQLCVERANFDLLMSALLCLSAWLLARAHPAAPALGCVLLGFATTLKLYTGLACALAWLIARQVRLTTFAAAGVSTLLALAVLGPATILALGQGAPEGATRFSTGAHWLLRAHGFPAAVIAVLFALSLTAWGWRVLRTVPAPDFARWPNRAALFAVAYLVAVPLFLLKDSYDYRMVLWLPCLALPLAWTRGGVHRRWQRLAVITIALFVVVAGAELPAGWLDRASGGWARDATTLLILAKQVAAWLLVGALSLVFAAWARPRLADVERAVRPGLRGVAR